MPKKKPMKGKPEVHEDLEGLEFNVNQFGEVKTSVPLDKINAFLNDNVEDKKLAEKKAKENAKKDNESKR